MGRRCELFRTRPDRPLPLQHLFIPNVVVSSKMLESHNSVAEGKGVALVRFAFSTRLCHR